ncbi:MAG TPA: protein-L-isoaspartate O-methyltransferase [Microvirga sp.]|jgi:protein-L-isoaspartate(D-aspartate) O-methyltransferase|nr:protein-L-isoaspartate O-methyltransferase [Microvirga sp.]
MVDFAQARRMMVDGQLRTFDVNDVPLLDAMGSVPRERFVLPGRESLAYIDQDLLVSDGPERRHLLAPMVLGRMIQALEIEPAMRVLDVAPGLGYSSAVLARLGAAVTALESNETLAAAARERLAGAGADAVTVVAGPLDQGYPAAAPYDAVLINGAVEVKPEALLQQLAEAGRLVCIQGRGRSAKATLYVRAGQAFGLRNIFDAAAPVLPEFQAAPGFVF